mmetsp:Transcript_40018/g.119778  ORF Transcript_40018/g.119778 Transcript_40018/m.119778 type:complete len:329 (-) Transcript_40018:269-1255(-)
MARPGGPWWIFWATPRACSSVPREMGCGLPSARGEATSGVRCVAPGVAGSAARCIGERGTAPDGLVSGCDLGAALGEASWPAAIETALGVATWAAKTTCAGEPGAAAPIRVRNRRAAAAAGDALGSEPWNGTGDCGATVALAASASAASTPVSGDGTLRRTCGFAGVSPLGSTASSALSATAALSSAGFRRSSPAEGDAIIPADASILELAPVPSGSSGGTAPLGASPGVGTMVYCAALASSVGSQFPSAAAILRIRSEAFVLTTKTGAFALNLNSLGFASLPTSASASARSAPACSAPADGMTSVYCGMFTVICPGDTCIRAIWASG